MDVGVDLLVPDRDRSILGYDGEDPPGSGGRVGGRNGPTCEFLDSPRCLLAEGHTWGKRPEDKKG